MDPTAVRPIRQSSRAPFAAIVFTLLALTVIRVTPAAAQLSEGIGLGLAPTVERVYWSDDLLLKDADLIGGRVSLNFGRYVGLEGYYLEEDGIDGEAGLGEFDLSRRGADVVFTLADARFTPFFRIGAGVIDFKDEDGVDSEHISTTLGAGIRFDLLDRVQTQVFVQDLAFRGRNAPFIQRVGEVENNPGGHETFHNLTVGAGVNFYLGGENSQPDTDLAFVERLRGGVSGLSVPIEVFAGELQFDDDLDLPNQRLAGARAGLDFGPYVGLRGYYMRGVADDFDDVRDFYGYGGEANFNLNRGEGFTPYLVVGLGRLDLGDDLRERSGADAPFIEENEERWTATAGAGLAFNVGDRLRFEAAARNLLFTRADVDDVTRPDQLTQNWLFSGGLRLSIGGATADAEDAERAIEEARRDARREAEDRDRDRDANRDGDRDRERGRHHDGRDRKRDDRPERDVIEIPVLENGEVYIRFGDSGTFERMDEPWVLRHRLPADSVMLRDSILIRREIGVDGGGPLTERELEALENRLDRLDERIADLQAALRAQDAERTVIVQPGETPRDQVEREEVVVVEPERTRGVFNGGQVDIAEIGVYGGASLHDPKQALLGFHTDLGSAWGGAVRFVPELTLGFLNDFTINLNGNLEWQLRDRVGSVRPYFSVGAGFLSGDGDLEILIPNLVIGGIMPVGEVEGFVAFQGLDLFDENRLIVGLRGIRPERLRF